MSTEATQAEFPFKRDPFKAPTEILPSHCSPSTPLCRFDYSQLKVVGVIESSEGSMKALVEDPEGQGYSVSAGQVIGNGTVMQISREGIHLRMHRGRDVTLPMFRAEGKGS